MVGVELGEPEVVEDEEVGSGEGSEELGVAAVAASDGEVVQEPGDAQGQSGEAVTAGVVGEGTGEPGLADPRYGHSGAGAGGTGDEDVEAFAQPSPGGEGVDEGLVEAPWVSGVDVLDAGVGVSQLGASQPAGHAAVVAQGEFAVGEQAEGSSNESASRCGEWSGSASAAAMAGHRSWWSLSMVGWVSIGGVSCGGSVEAGRPADVVVVGGQGEFEGVVGRLLVEAVLEACPRVPESGDGLDGALPEREPRVRARWAAASSLGLE